MYVKWKSNYYGNFYGKVVDARACPDNDSRGSIKDYRIAWGNNDSCDGTWYCDIDLEEITEEEYLTFSIMEA